MKQSYLNILFYVGDKYTYMSKIWIDYNCVWSIVTVCNVPTNGGLGFLSKTLTLPLIYLKKLGVHKAFRTYLFHPQ